eukprot:1872223-Amphidinium_carterae.1
MPLAPAMCHGLKPSNTSYFLGQNPQSLFMFCPCLDYMPAFNPDNMQQERLTYQGSARPCVRKTTLKCLCNCHLFRNAL